MSQHVTITKDKHDTLLQTAKDFEALKAALYRGGVTSETLEVLIQQPLRRDSGPTCADWATLVENETQASLPGWYDPFQAPLPHHAFHTINALPGKEGTSEFKDQSKPPL